MDQTSNTLDVPSEEWAVYRSEGTLTWDTLYY